MKIAIDISQMAYTGTGVGRYVSGLTRAILTADSPHHFVLYAGARQKRPFFDQLTETTPYDKAKFRLLSIPPKLAPFIFLLPLKLDQLIGGVDLLHTSDWVEPATSCPRVTTVHDLVFRQYPATVDPLVRLAQSLRLGRIKNNHTRIITDSKSTKIDLMNIYHIDDKQIDVVYPGIESFYRPVSSKEIDRVKVKYGIHGRYLLSVGTQEPRKNLARVIEAFTTLRKDESWQDVSLVLVGRYGWGKTNAHADHVISTGYVADGDLPALYCGADVFVYPSLYEGFGFPVAEAMACGTPVVTSNISSLPEVAGDAGILVDPLVTSEIIGGIKKAFASRTRLSQLGIKQAALFGWSRAAEQIISIYEKVGAKS